MKDETECLHAGYTPENREPRVLPIVQNTTYVYDSAVEVAAIFDDSTRGLCYSRFSNPTMMAVEQKITELEDGVGTICTTSGQAAAFPNILNICTVGGSITNTPIVYGGTIDLPSLTLKKLGIECIYVNNDASDKEIRTTFKPNTKLMFGEIIANSALKVFGIKKFANVTREMGVPLIVDNAFATPILCGPFAFGADIVIHSTNKYMDGHAIQIGRVIVDSGRFDWRNSKSPELTEPDESYHEISYTGSYGNMAYIIRARMQLIGDFGVYPVTHSAFLLNLDPETLPVRMRQYREDAMTVAKYLEESDVMESVLYPGLPGNHDCEFAEKYLKECSSVISFIMKGGRPAAAEFVDSLKLASNEVHVADIRTCVLRLASETYRQLTDGQLAATGISERMIHFSVELENIGGIIEDLDLALKASMS